MMYRNKLVACIKVNGKILRESSDVVTIPFGSEYSILLKNLDSKRMQIRVHIDGDDATGWIIINANSSVELERFVKGNMNSGNRFKFIERTEAVENYRGVKEDDGLIRIEYAVEKLPELNLYNSFTWTPAYNNGQWSTQGFTSNIGQARSLTSNAVNLNNVQCSAIMDSGFNEQGITVPGSISDQKFTYVSGFNTEPSEVLIIHLKGKIKETPVQKAITVSDRKQCAVCGRKNKFSNKFCGTCGTSLFII